ncbi:LPD38 domain-containing protein [Edwardsiella piscicida]|uniref:LPD38 domain-containing protein n=1 Tax=Edwardsiella piscicida TaxID=1263550 RepID=UPI002479D114|nr:LPD38 domain-containing protein [Edwardsiella piscicida]WGS78569.1 LPD5 domain-containing protein [Edwardsiella piscicida]WGS81954.1 LPD5 domain-containing protein [Edwardsiella piscicida]
MANAPQDLRPEQQRSAAERQSLNIQRPDEGLSAYWDSYDPQKYAGFSDALEEDSGTLFSDTGNLLLSGAVSTAASLREVARKVMPDSVVSVATDLLANQVPGFDEATFWRDAQQKAVGRLSADMQQARDKTFWESGQGFGEAWGDPRSYFAGAVESLPGMVVSMIPAMRLAKLTYSAKVAQGVAATEAAASAARVARLTGSISEGVLAGGASSRAVKEAIYALPDDVLQHSEAAQNLLASGMSVEAIRRALAEDASTKAFLMSGVATGLFGGQGDTVLAKIMTGQLKQGIVKRIAKGAVAEGILEEMPQSALSQMAENYALQTADPQRPLSEAVMNQALGGVAIGGVMGGTLAGASRPGRWQAPSDALQAEDAPQAENDNTTADAAAEAAEAQTPEAYQRYQTQFAPLDRDALLQHYVDADLSEAPDAAEKKRAAHERLQALEHDDEVKAAAQQLRRLPRRDLLAQYHTLNEKATRTAAEQLQWEAARQVLRQEMAPQTQEVDDASPSSSAVPVTEEQRSPALDEVDSAMPIEDLEASASEDKTIQQAVVSAPLYSEQPQPPTEPSGESEAEPAVSPSSANIHIEDFGEVIHGAAKHRWAALAEAMREPKTEHDYQTEPLSKLLPKPDYEKMARAGTDNKTLALLALLRGQIPVKPRSPHKLRRWIQQVQQTRDIAGQVLAGTLPVDSYVERLRQDKGAHIQRMLHTWELLSGLPAAQLTPAASYRVHSASYSLFDGQEYDPPKVIYTLENAQGRALLSSADRNDLYRQARAYFAQQAIASPSADERTSFEIYKNRATQEIFIGYGKNKTPLKTGFSSLAEARNYLQSQRGELLATLHALREQSKEEQRNTTNRARVGKPRRQGVVTPEQFRETFGFRGVQFGNYVENTRRQSDLNQAYDALLDMAEVLNVPPSALSLNGRLGLAFGARGKGGRNAASAHYEPGQVAINLTKAQGAGSLAHEWFHALDNYFGEQTAQAEPSASLAGVYVTQHRRAHHRHGERAGTESPVRQEVFDAFTGIIRAINDSGMQERAARLDRVRSKPYWSTEIEMAARAFERYVQQRAQAKQIENDFLVNIRKASDHGAAETYAYPTQQELDGGIGAAFDTLFSTLKTRETERGIAFYSHEQHPVQRPPWPADFPDVVLHARLGDATAHPDYAAAKGGDKDAAYRLVADVLNKAAIDDIRGIIGNHSVVLTAVHAEEASGRNKIPQAMAEVLGKVLHQEVDSGIVQTVRVGRSGLDGFGRLANQPGFAGEVRRDVPYFILDDTLTQGGTLAGLRGYIETQGGQVIGASALTGKRYSAKMALSAATLARLRTHLGGSNLENWWKQQFGYGFSGLTESEAHYLLRAGDADAIRDRLLAARQTGSPSILPEPAGDGRSLPPDVTHRAAQNASPHGGVSVLGEGNRLTETGHSPEVASGNNPIPQINAIVRGVLRKLNAPSLHVRVVQTQKEAEPLAGEPLEQYGKVHAFYRPQSQEIVLIADNLPTPRMVREKLRHEVIHHALEQVITPEEYQRIIDRVMETRASRDAVIQQIWRRIDAAYGQEPIAVQAGEFLAHMAEKQMPGRFSALWDRVVSLLKTLFNRIGLLPTVDAENRIYLRDTLRTLGQRLRQGYRPTGSATSADVPNAKASTSQAPLKPLAEEAEKPGTPLSSEQKTRSADDVRNSQARYSREGTALEQTIRRKMGLEPERGWGDKAHDVYRDWTAQSPSARKGWLRDLGRRLNTATFDGLAPIKYAEESQGKAEAASSAYIAARLAAGANTVMAATLEHGLPVYNPQSGVIERKAGSGKSDALLGILDALGKHREDFFIWIAGHRSERLMQEGREKLFSADEIRHMKARDRGKETLFARQKVKYDALVKSLLDLQQATGLISPERRATWEDAWYLPYFRQTEDGRVVGPWSTRGIANQRSTVRRLKGSEQAINDPVENLVNYAARAIDAAMKNEAMRRMVVNLADSGVIETIEKPNRIDYQRLGKRQGVAKVYLEGEEQLVEVSDPALFRAITMMDVERSNALFMRAARQAKRILTIGTTSMPDFIIRNFMRDSLHSWAINQDGVRAVTSAWAGLKKAYRQDDTLIEMMFAGATFGGGYANAYDPASTAQSMRAILRRKGYSDSQVRRFESSILRDGQDALRRLGGVWSRYRHLSEAAENANRVATYQAALKAGKGSAQAAFEARDLMDFSMQGAAKSMIALTDMLPFFNARMQGVGKLARAVKANPQAVVTRGGLIAAASVALLAANWDDERYEALPDWDKDIYWHFFIGDQHFRLPKPFEIGLMFATLPERMIRAIGGKESGKKFAKLVAHNFMEQLAFNPIPQIALPLAENLVNYDFFSGNPIEGMADANLLAGARYDQRTSLLARQVGEQLGWSPKKIDHLITGYTGTLGAYVLGAMDIVLRGMGEYGERPALRLDELPVIRSFLRGAAPAKSTQYSDDFYRMMQQANQVYGTVQRWKREHRIQDSRALSVEKRGVLASRRRLNRTQREVRQLNSQIQLVQLHTSLSAEEKRQRIDRLLARRNRIVQQAVMRVNRWFD